MTKFHEIAQIIRQYNRLHRKCRAEFSISAISYWAILPIYCTHIQKRNTYGTSTKTEKTRMIAVPDSGALLAHASEWLTVDSSAPLAHTHHPEQRSCVNRRPTMRSDRGSRVAADKRRVGRKNAPFVSVKRWHWTGQQSSLLRSNRRDLPIYLSTDL